MNSFITRIVTNTLEGNVPSVMRKVMPSLIGTFVSLNVFQVRACRALRPTMWGCERVFGGLRYFCISPPRTNSLSER